MCGGFKENSARPARGRIMVCKVNQSEIAEILVMMIDDVVVTVRRLVANFEKSLVRVIGRLVGMISPFYSGFQSTLSLCHHFMLSTFSDRYQSLST